MIRRNGSASAFTAGAALTKSSRYGDRKYPRWRHHQHRHPDRGEERLVDCAVDLLGLARTRESGDEDAHAGEERADEDDDDDEDLPRHTDRGVRLVADEVADQDVIDHAL